MDLELDIAKRCSRLACPELLLWIAEASGIDSKKVQAFANEAKEIIDNGTNGRARTKAGTRIRQEISWAEIIESIENNG